LNGIVFIMNVIRGVVILNIRLGASSHELRDSDVLFSRPFVRTVETDTLCISPEQLKRLQCMPAGNITIVPTRVFCLVGRSFESLRLIHCVFRPNSSNGYSVCRLKISQSSRLGCIACFVGLSCILTVQPSQVAFKIILRIHT
jgi:hypothetical protein